MIFKLNKKQLLSEQTDEQLITGFQETGKSELAGELFNRYAHLVYGVCLKYVKDKEECKDIAMSVFEKLQAHLPSTDIQIFKNWLLTIAKNQCITFLRTKNQNVEQIGDWQELEKKSKIFMEYEDFSSPIDEEPEERKIQAALAQLKADQRKCLELFFYKNMSYKEIEKKTNFTAQEVKSFLQNGKRNLKLILGSGQFDPDK